MSDLKKLIDKEREKILKKDMIISFNPPEGFANVFDGRPIDEKLYPGVKEYYLKQAEEFHTRITPPVKDTYAYLKQVITTLKGIKSLAVHLTDMVYKDEPNIDFKVTNVYYTIQDEVVVIGVQKVDIGIVTVPIIIFKVFTAAKVLEQLKNNNR